MVGFPETSHGKSENRLSEVAEVEISSKLQHSASTMSVVWSE